MKDQQLRDSFKNKRCFICNHLGCDPCHIQTYGSTRKDDVENIVNMCRKHHVEQGQIGWKKMSEKYIVVLIMLAERGFSFNEWNKLIKN